MTDLVVHVLLSAGLVFQGIALIKLERTVKALQRQSAFGPFVASVRDMTERFNRQAGRQ